MGYASRRLLPVRLQGAFSHVDLGIEAMRALHRHGATQKFLDWSRQRAKKIHGSEFDLLIAALSLTGVFIGIQPDEGSEKRHEIAADLLERGVRGEAVMDLLQDLIGFYEKKGQRIISISSLVQTALSTGQFCRVPRETERWFHASWEELMRSRGAVDVAKRAVRSVDDEIRDNVRLDPWMFRRMQAARERTKTCTITRFA